MSLFTCLHTKKINKNPLVGKNYRLNSSSWGVTKNYGFSDLFSDKQHRNRCIFMSSIVVWWMTNAPIVCLRIIVIQRCPSFIFVYRCRINQVWSNLLHITSNYFFIQMWLFYRKASFKKLLLVSKIWNGESP